MRIVLLLMIFFTMPIYAADVILMSSFLKTKDDYTFIPDDAIKLPNGKIKKRYREYYKNIPVLGFSFAATVSPDGDLKDIFGYNLTNIEKDLTSTWPRFSEKNAIQIGMKKIKTKDPIKLPEVQLFIMYDDATNKARLVYLISFMLISNDKTSQPTFIIDANTGEILKQWEGIANYNATGPGGNVKAGQYYYGRDYGYLSVTNNGNICVMDNAYVTTSIGTFPDGPPFQFTCPENTYRFLNGAYSPVNDAHFFAGVTTNMYLTWFQITPWKEKIKVFAPDTVGGENAYSNAQGILLGGGGPNYYPLTNLDTVAHEIGHGVISRYSKLFLTEQAGGINESFCDISGEAAEYFFYPQRNDWLVGAEITKNKIATRYFADPTRDGKSIDHASKYYNGLDVHYSSGVFNKAFYYLAIKANWNTEKAFRAFMLANQLYWKYDTTFDLAACGVLKAAGDLGYSTSDVISAFNVVGVNASCECVHNPLTALYVFSLPAEPGKGISFQMDLRNNDTAACPPSNYKLSILSVTPRLTAAFNRTDVTVRSTLAAVVFLDTKVSLAALDGAYNIIFQVKNLSYPNDPVLKDKLTVQVKKP